MKKEMKKRDEEEDDDEDDVDDEVNSKRTTDSSSTLYKSPPWNGRSGISQVLSMRCAAFPPLSPLLPCVGLKFGGVEWIAFMW